VPTLCYASAMVGEAVLLLGAAMEPTLVPACLLFFVSYKLATAFFMLSAAHQGVVSSREAVMVSAQWVAAVALLLVALAVDHYVLDMGNVHDDETDEFSVVFS
jgi:hypothetical protein